MGASSVVAAQNVDAWRRARHALSIFGASGTLGPIVRTDIPAHAAAVFDLAQLAPDGADDRSAVVVSDRPIATMSDVAWPGGAAAAIGHLTPSTDLVVPLALRHYYDQNTLIAVQNTLRTRVARVDVRLFAAGSATPLWSDSVSIDAGRAAVFDLGRDPQFSSLPMDFVGSMRLQVADGAPIVAQALVYQTSSDQAVYGYEALPAGMTGRELIAPLFRHNWFGDTGMSIVNPHPYAVDVTVSYAGTDVSGNACRNMVIGHPPVRIPPNSNALVYQGAGGGHGLPAPCFGSATIRATDGVLAIVNDAVTEGRRTLSSAAYVALPAAHARYRVAIPRARNEAGNHRMTTGLQILNASDGRASIELRFSDARGLILDTCSDCRVVVPPRGAANFVLGRGGLGNPFPGSYGAAMIVSSQPVLAIANDFSYSGTADASTFNAVGVE